MVELDSKLMGQELESVSLLAIQFILALIAVAAAYWGRSRIVLALLLVLALLASCLTIYHSVQTEESTRRRLEGNIPGQFLPAERGENHLAWLARQRWLSAGAAFVTVVGAGYLRNRSRIAAKVAVNR